MFAVAQVSPTQLCEAKAGREPHSWVETSDSRLAQDHSMRHHQASAPCVPTGMNMGVSHT